MSDRSPPQAFLFWDESAFPNANMSGYEVVKAVRTFAANIGPIMSLRFYVDIEGNESLSPGLRSELQCSGVSIIDTVACGRQCAASKMLSTDLFVHAVNNVDITSVIIVISADPDLGYPISMLRMRGEHVMLVCPAKVDSQFLHSVDGTILEGNVLEAVIPTATPMQHSANPPLAISPQSIPPHFQVMVDFLNDARVTKGIMVYERGFLAQHLLELHQTVLKEAGVSNFVNPMAEYINRAVALGIVQTWDDEGVQLMPSFLTGASAESPSHKSDRESAGEATPAQQEDGLPSLFHSTMQARLDDTAADKASGPICQPYSSPSTPLAKNQASSLVVSVDSFAVAEDDEATPTVNDTQSLYLRCVEAVEANSNSTGLIGAAILLGDIDTTALREKIRLGLYDEDPQVFYADVLSMFDDAQTHYQQCMNALEDAQEMEKAFDIAFYRHFAGKIDSKKVFMTSLPPSSSEPQALSGPSETSIVHYQSRSAGLDGNPPPQTLVPALATHLANLGAPSPLRHSAWSTADLPWPIPTQFHVLVQFLNEEQANHGISIYSWDLLKIPILRRRPNLLEECIGAVGGKKSSWDLYLQSAVDLGILSEIKNPCRVSLTQPFMLDWHTLASSRQVTASTSPRPQGSNSVDRRNSNSMHSLPNPIKDSIPVTAVRDAASQPPLIHIPPHFHVLIEYLKAEMAAGTLVHRRCQLGKPLLSRQPNLLIDAGLSSKQDGESPMIRYFQAAAELGIVGMNEATKPETLWLSPEYFTWHQLLAGEPIAAPTASAFPGVPTYFDALIYYLRARRSAGLFFVPREALYKPLLERQPDVFLQAGTARFKNPIHRYICEAETLGIVVKEGQYVSLHPKYY